ncbi:MAG: O-antigen ligase family protein [Gammaproteobacteria bacterium]
MAGQFFFYLFMSPSVATLLTVSFISYLFFLDYRNQSKVDVALWLPVLWMAIIGSRFPTQWLNLGSENRVEAEGGLIDVVYFLTLIILGIRVLVRRRLEIGKLTKNNIWVVAFFLFCFMSIAWSDFPLVAFKRFVKVLGHPVMALIIVTDANPPQALTVVMKRCAYLFMPLSVLFIKYYPQYGRGFDAWTGEAYNNGIMLNKNELGYGCMVYGIFFCWKLLTARGIEDPKTKRKEILLSTGFIFGIGWLLFMARSSTSLVTFIVGGLTIGLIALPMVSKRFIGSYLIMVLAVAGFAEWSFDIREKIIELLGEDPTLTDRTIVWADCLALVDNPVFGAGFESFWLGPRLDILWAKWWWQPNQAHNGYIETYLNLGGIGVFLLAGMIYSTFRKSSRQLLTDFDFGRLRLGYLFAIILYNYTEATFKAVHLVWTIFHIIALDYPQSIADETTDLKTKASFPRYPRQRKRRPSNHSVRTQGTLPKGGLDSQKEIERPWGKFNR